jgi:hypothetical protein
MCSNDRYPKTALLLFTNQDTTLWHCSKEVSNYLKHIPNLTLNDSCIQSIQHYERALETSSFFCLG